MRVLVVDNVQTIADTLAQILRNSGFEAFVPYNGESAIATAIDVKPDLLISDVFMEEVNGVEAAVRIRSFIPKCKVILYSGQPDLASILHRGRLEEYSFEILHKRIAPHHLLARIMVLAGMADSCSHRSAE